MGDRPYRRWWAAVAVSALACLAGCTSLAPVVLAPPGGVPPAPAAPTAAPPTAPPAAPLGGPVRLLQMNLCASGIAACYTGGRSITEAAAAIRAEAPDLVTLNEVCRDDVAALERAFAGIVPGGRVASAFQPAREGPTGAPYPCADGDEYGVGVLARWPAVPGRPVDSGIYPDQDPEDPEQRAWLCLDVASPALSVCTTHLAYTDRAVTVAQCRYLFGTVAAGVRARHGTAPLVLGADLNLGPGDNPDIASCLPDGSARVDDGGQQQVVGTPDLVVEDSRLVDLRDTTDHAGLLVTLAPRSDPPR